MHHNDLFLVGANVDAVDKAGNTALHIAARYGHELLIDTLLSNRANPLRYVVISLPLDAKTADVETVTCC